MPTLSEDQSQSLQRILLVRRSSLGDIINTMPTLVALRRGFPDAYIAWLVDHRFSQILEGHECLDEIIPVRRYSARKVLPLIGELRRARRLLHGRHFDITVDTQGLLKSSVLCYLSGAPRRLGFDDEREFSRMLMNESVPAEQDMHAVDRFLLMAKYLGCPTEPVEFRVPIAEAARQWVGEFLAANSALADRPLVGLNLGATGAHRRWPMEYFARLAQMLHDGPGAAVVLIGGPGDRALAESVRQQTTVPLIDAVGQTTLRQLPALISRCDVLISGDTGSMHISVALDRPTVALIGPTFPHLTGPYGDNHILLWSKPECACWNKPTCRDYPCMRAISPESALQAVVELLARDT